MDVPVRLYLLGPFRAEHRGQDVEAHLGGELP